MNVLVHIIALLALFWFMGWLIDRDQDVLAMVTLGLGLYFIASLIDSAIIEVSNRRRKGR